MIERWVYSIGKAGPWRPLSHIVFFGGITWIIGAVIGKVFWETPSPKTPSFLIAAGTLFLFACFAFAFLIALSFTLFSAYQLWTAIKRSGVLPPPTTPIIVPTPSTAIRQSVDLKTRTKWEPCPRCNSSRVQSAQGWASLFGMGVGALVGAACLYWFLGSVNIVVMGFAAAGGLLILLGLSSTNAGDLKCSDCAYLWRYGKR